MMVIQLTTAMPGENKDEVVGVLCVQGELKRASDCTFIVYILWMLRLRSQVPMGSSESKCNS